MMALLVLSISLVTLTGVVLHFSIVSIDHFLVVGVSLFVIGTKLIFVSLVLQTDLCQLVF